jgi:hypothetical protein
MIHQPGPKPPRRIHQAALLTLLTRAQQDRHRLNGGSGQHNKIAMDQMAVAIGLVNGDNSCRFRTRGRHLQALD